MAFRSRALIAFVGLGAAQLPLAAFLGRFETAGDPWPRFLVLYGAAAIIYLISLAAWSALRDSVRQSGRLLLFVLAIGVLARLAIFPLSASDDVNRYLWEGRLQHLGGNPYQVAPADAAARYAEAGRDPFLSRVNHPELSTIYPPVAELVFFLFTGVAYDLRAWKAFVLVSDLLLIALLLRLLALRREPLSGIVRYAWHPLPWISFAGEGHVDSFMLMIAMIGWVLLARGRRWGAAIAFTISLATKVTSAIYLPLISRRIGARVVLVLALGLLILSWPYREAGWRLVHVLGRFGWRMGHNGSAHALLSWVTDPQTARVLVLLLLAAVLIWVWRRDDPPIKGALNLTGALLLLSPTVHPWYATWVIPFLVFHPVRPWVLLSATVGIAYAAYGVRSVTGEFHIDAAMRVAEWVPVYALLAWEWVRSRSLSLTRAEP